ncbi:MAG: hypothetical protein H8D45_26250 [Bacteroidetes bacterium]|nr:hypothetical protein [Bacteroidota bacterium]
MTTFNQCPNCGKKPSAGYKKIHECKKCGTHYCHECGGDRCPKCASKERREAGKCWK